MFIIFNLTNFKKKIMKKYLFSILLFSNIFHAQVKNGSVQYSIVSNITNENETLEFIINENNKIIESAKIASYTLNFNESKSYFTINPVLLKNYDNVGKFSNAIGTKSFYIDAKENISKFYKDDDLLGEYVTDYKQESIWITTNETKMIGDYLCYKATSVYYNQDGWNENPNLIVTAWYTPKIPVSYGPSGYGGLPGLILELTTRKFTLFVKKIDLNLSVDPEIKSFDKVRFLTKYQADMMFKKALSVEQKKFYEEQQAIIDKRKKDKANTVIPK
jgi:GLPGLI family protein